MLRPRLCMVAQCEEQQPGSSVAIAGSPFARSLGAAPEAGKESPLAEIAAGLGTDVATYTRETPGMSTFALEDGLV
jgi:hypothetical protein